MSYWVFQQRKKRGRLDSWLADQLDRGGTWAVSWRRQCGGVGGMGRRCYLATGASFVRRDVNAANMLMDNGAAAMDVFRDVL